LSTIDGHAARLKWYLLRQTYISVFQTDGLEPKNAPSSRDIISYPVKQVNTAVTAKGDRVQRGTGFSPLIVRNILAHQGWIKHVGEGAGQGDVSLGALPPEAEQYKLLHKQVVVQFHAFTMRKQKACFCYIPCK